MDNQQVSHQNYLQKVLLNVNNKLVDIIPKSSLHRY